MHLQSVTPRHQGDDFWGLTFARLAAWSSWACLSP